MSDPLIEVDELTIAYPMADGRAFRAIDKFSMTVNRGQIVGIVGESGAGKSTIGKATLGLLDENAVIDTGGVLLDEVMVTKLEEHAFTDIRGSKIGYIYQNPMTALNPVLTIGEQIIEAIEANTSKRGAEARTYAIELLKQAEVPLPEERLSQYPHQLSGGLCQRIVFAIAISAQPDLIIADEPTTALDVTVQKAVLGTLVKLTRRENIAIILITHDIWVWWLRCVTMFMSCDTASSSRKGQQAKCSGTPPNPTAANSCPRSRGLTPRSTASPCLAAWAMPKTVSAPSIT